MTERRWHIWIDRGGTFTDLVALGPDGQIHATKLLSESAEHYDDAAIEGIRRLLGLAQGAALPHGCFSPYAPRRDGDGGHAGRRGRRVRPP